MKPAKTLMTLTICAVNFCLLVQQTIAQNNSMGDLPDSQIYLRSNTNVRPNHNYSRQVEDLLARMTVEEKVGQMTQLQIATVTSGSEQATQIDPAKLEKTVVKYAVGSILNVPNEGLPVDKWREIIGKIQEASQRTRLKIPVLYGIDSIHGAGYVLGATLHPQEIGMAATWDPLLMQKLSEITAVETRAASIPWTFSPVLDLGRQPLWPRFWETFGEDPYLASVMGVAFVRGIEGNDIGAPNHVAASLKHYVGYSFPLNGRDRTPAWIPENYLREYFLPSFAAAVRAGARTVMVNSAEINGTPGHTNRHLLTEVLKGELGFQGFVVSDWQDIQKLVTVWHAAADEKEATRMAIMAGIDMSMVPDTYTFSDLLIELVKEGKVPMSRIDDAVRRILRVKFELGLFEHPMSDEGLKAQFATAESRAVSLQAARESITLLKNDNNILPLAQGRKVLVTGPTANSLIPLNNGWTYTWQGNKASLYPKDRPTILEAIQSKIRRDNVTYQAGVDFDKELDVSAAVAAARNADVAIVCVGESSYTETPGNITDITMSEPQLKLAEAIEATGKPVILVLVEGRPRVINRIVGGAAGILMAYNPSNEGGTAIADVLFGDYNPGGKLPFTYPRTPNSYLTYDHKLFETEATGFGNAAFTPQFDFGSGLSYTTFKYDNLKVNPSNPGVNDPVTVSLNVTNTGKRAGQETVIVYLRDEVASLTPPGKRVKRFAKLSLQPGETRALSFTLNRDDLSFIGADNKPTVEPGDFTVFVGGLTAKFTLH